MSPEGSGTTTGSSWWPLVEAHRRFVNQGGLKHQGLVVKVYAAVLSHADRVTGECTASRARIRALIGGPSKEPSKEQTPSDPYASITRALKVLEAEGYIKDRKGGGDDTLVCTVVLPARPLAPAQGVTRAQGDPLRQDQGTPCAGARENRREENWSSMNYSEEKRPSSVEAVELRLHHQLCDTFKVCPAPVEDQRREAKQTRSDFTTLGKIAHHVTKGRTIEEAIREAKAVMSEANRVSEEKKREGRGRRIATFTNRMKARYPGLFDRNGEVSKPQWEGARR